MNNWLLNLIIAAVCIVATVFYMKSCNNPDTTELPPVDSVYIKENQRLKEESKAHEDSAKFFQAKYDSVINFGWRTKYIYIENKKKLQTITKSQRDSLYLIELNKQRKELENEDNNINF